MAYKIIETELGQKDLSDIVDYIIHSLENPSAAATLLNEVETCYDGLERLPMMFEACRDPHLKALGYRKAIIRNYIMSGFQLIISLLKVTDNTLKQLLGHILALSVFI